MKSEGEIKGDFYVYVRALSDHALKSLRTRKNKAFWTIPPGKDVGRLGMAIALHRR